jgi:heat shock protein 4
VSTEDQREEAKTLCREIEDWLYDAEAKSAGVSDLKAKLQGVKKVAKPIFDRYAESKARPLAVTKAQKKLAEMQAKMANWTQTLPWITEEEKSVVIELINVAEKWIADKETEQAALETSVQPAYLASDVPLQLRAADAAFEKLKGKKKPEPPKVDKNETVTVNVNSTTTAGSASDDQVEDRSTVNSEGQDHNSSDGKESEAPSSDSTEASSDSDPASEPEL